MQLTLNGETRDVGEGRSVAWLIAASGLGDGACAAEVNGALVPRAEHETTILREGDVVELVTLVGGG